MKENTMDDVIRADQLPDNLTAKELALLVIESFAPYSLEQPGLERVRAHVEGRDGRVNVVEDGDG